VQFINTPDHNVLMFTLNGEGIPGETWRRVCVVLNSADGNDVQINLPGAGEWHVALDETGAAEARAISGKCTVRYKSGIVLFQQ
jgi:hypothetical protein